MEGCSSVVLRGPGHGPACGHGGGCEARGGKAEHKERIPITKVDCLTDFFLGGSLKDHAGAEADSSSRESGSRIFCYQRLQ